MTSPRTSAPYGTAAVAPAPLATPVATSPPLSSAGHTWRVVLTGTTAAAAVPAAGVVAFLAAVVGSGCFISCGEPNRLGGFGLGLLALVLVLAAPVLARLLWRRWVAFWITAAVQVAVVPIAFSGFGLLSS